MSAVAPTRPRAFVVWFRDFHRWSVGSFIETGWRWPAETIRPLSTALTRKSVDLNRATAPADAIRLVTLHFDGEMELRHESAGESFKGRLFHADPGDVIYSKIDVRNGAIGIIPDELGRVCVSSEYPVYSVDPTIAEAPYVKLLFRTEVFRRKINSMISGASGRKRVQPSDLESVDVPLPPLPVQRKIVAAWEAARKYAVDTAAKIEGLERLIEAQVLATINLTVEPPQNIRGVFSIPLSQFERWDLFFYRPDFLALERSLDELNSPSLGQVLKLVSRPWTPKDFPSGTFRYVEISNVRKEAGITGARTVKVEEAPSRATTLIRTGDLIISTTRPYLGAIAIVPKEFDGCVCSSGFALCSSTTSNDISLEFVFEFLKSAAGLRQMERRMTGGLYPAITQDELEKVRIPVPSRSSQGKFIERTAGIRSQIASLTADAKAYADAARVELEAMILGTKAIII